MITKTYKSKYETTITKKMLEYDMYNDKLSQRQIAEKHKVGKGTIQNLQYRYGLEILNLYKRRIPEKLTKKQKELVYGTSIADGHIFRKNKKRHGALKIVHSVKQEEYLNFKYGLLKDFVRTKPTIQISRVKNSVSVAKSFRTLTHPFFTKLHKILYKKKQNRYVKHLSLEVLNHVSSFSLAIIFMDDGTKHNKSKDFCFECFPYEEQVIFCNWLKSKFDINANIMRYKNGHRTRIHSKSVPDFIKIIKPYIINCMKYKL